MGEGCQVWGRVVRYGGGLSGKGEGCQVWGRVVR